uniref:Beta-mannosidase B n=1 Tax=uncultured bacterium Contig1578 TaxID=1393460 RepID=W0FJW3_9BACT|nr:beta-mannosidase [uncultured bacterium Contig1578]
MQSISLNGAWTLDVTDEAGRGICAGVPATVPGSVYGDLLAAGLLADPYWRDNEDAALRLMEHDFAYSRAFEVTEALLACDRVLLRCEGLDTLATVEINGAAAGRADNMHRTWEFDVGPLLRPGRNTICVRFASPVRYIRQSYATNRADGAAEAMTGFANLRKAHCMFGWDWGPRLPDAGIWRDIALVGVEIARIRDVRVHQSHADGAVDCDIIAHVVRCGGAPVRLEAVLTDPEGRAVASAADGADRRQTRTLRLRAEAPRLWWPNGLGAQPLYTLCARLVTLDGRELDRWERRIGLRTVTVNRGQDAWGEQFCFCVNGVDVFAMGADYVPEDNLLGRVTPQRTRRLLSDAVAANMNCVRVWGGGYYPDDFFYDICDELGLLVWQDFMFACAVYNLTPAFEESIRAELTDNIRRIRHHACLALWCGNNEMEQFVAQGVWVSGKRQVADYIKMYEYIFPQILSREDPDAFYWPSSPSSGGSFDDPGDEHRGDVHYWEVWHGLRPFTEYRRHLFRFASEFGFQAFPCMATIESFTEPGDRNPFSYVMEKHQRNAAANGRIVQYLSQMYLYPSRFDAFVYASQLLQAQAIQYAVEHWRRHRGRCMGAVVWQLNDCWPVVSWSSIDYYGRWKALHYFEKRFFAPVLISCREEGLLEQQDSVNAEPYAPRLTARLNVSNETPRAFSGEARWSLRRPDASVIREGRFDVETPAFSAQWLEELDFSGEDPYGCYFAWELADREGAPVGSGAALFCPPKHFRFEDPGLEARLEGREIVVSARAFARCVELRCGPDVVLEDNFFDMNAGTRRVRVLRGAPEGVEARSVYDIR